MWFVLSRVMSNAYGSSKTVVLVAGAVEQHHLVALVEDRVAQSGTVLGDGSAEVDHRACVPDDFLHGAGHVGVEIALEQASAQVGGEVGEAPADRVAGRFVAAQSKTKKP